MPKFYKLTRDNTIEVIEANGWYHAYVAAKEDPSHQPILLSEQELRDLLDNIVEVLA